MGLRPLLALAAAATAVVASPASLAARDDTKKIKWGDCDIAIPSDDIECGNLEVPRDYTDDGDDAKTLKLSLAKVPAPNESKGSILVNFGGPGSPSIETLSSVAPLLHNMTGGNHDLVTFDPRGTGDTMTLSCFEDAEEREFFSARYPTPHYDTSDVTAGQLWANMGMFASYCNETVEGDDGELIGTAFVARDMMEIVDALDEDGMLRYWGMSYGTILGATAATMFPDRIDKMVLDGVVNPEKYYHSFYTDPDQQLGVDAAWKAFMGECIEAGDKCALSSLNDTADDLVETLDRAAESYRTDPVVAGEVVITYSAVQSFYFNLLKTLKDVEAMTEAIALLVAREDLEEVGPEMGTTDSAGAHINDEAFFGIGCSDAIPRADSLEDVMDEVEFVMATSRLAGLIPYSAMACAQWPFDAKERKTVDEEVETKNPVLILGNTYDPSTAIDSAYKINELFPGSVVVEQKGFGHTSIAQRSECTFKAVGDYFTSGDLPDGNIECEVDTPLFGGEDTESVTEEGSPSS